MLASRFVTNSVFCLFAFTTYVLVVVVLFIAAIALVSIAPSLVAIAVVVAVAPVVTLSILHYLLPPPPRPSWPRPFAWHDLWGLGQEGGGGGNRR